MKKAYILIAVFFITTLLSAEDIKGEWTLKTELIQIIDNGQIMGFANPKKEKSITSITIEDKKAIFTYGSTKYKADFIQKDRYLVLTLSSSKDPITITIIPLKDKTYKFSYCLDAKKEPASSTGKTLFINYIGTMIPANN